MSKDDKIKQCREALIRAILNRKLDAKLAELNAKRAAFVNVDLIDKGASIFV